MNQHRMIKIACVTLWLITLIWTQIIPRIKIQKNLTLTQQSLAILENCLAKHQQLIVIKGEPQEVSPVFKKIDLTSSKKWRVNHKSLKPCGVLGVHSKMFLFPTNESDGIIVTQNQIKRIKKKGLIHQAPKEIEILY